MEACAKFEEISSKISRVVVFKLHPQIRDDLTVQDNCQAYIKLHKLSLTQANPVRPHSVEINYRINTLLSFKHKKSL